MQNQPKNLTEKVQIWALNCQGEQVQISALEEKPQLIKCKIKLLKKKN